MKWLLGLMVLFALALAVLLVPVQGRTLWSRGAGREVALFVAHGLRAGWDAVAGLTHDHVHPTRAATAHSTKAKPGKQQAAQGGSRTSREGIVQQPVKETLQPRDQAALQDLIAHSR